MNMVTCPFGKEFKNYKKDPTRGKFCSKACTYKYRAERPKGLSYKIVAVNKGWIKKGDARNIGRKASVETLKRMSEARKGKRSSPETEFKKGENKGESNIKWKGDKVGYFGLHTWVQRSLGKATKCSECGSTGNVQWANKSWEYKRDLEDWLELCFKCHRRYDMQNWGAATKKFNLKQT